jgi:putative spermidine/putrescine transport system ATP-binding protein
MAFLEIDNVRKLFGQSIGVDTFDMRIEKGEFISFLGPSGCGKTTTLRMVAGFEVPTSGTIRIDSTDMTHTPPNRRNVGMVFQSYALFPNMTVANNIGFGLRVAGQAKADIQQRVAEMLELIHMAEYGPRFPYQLSGGQQQRVALARAIAIRPQVLLLDEPLSALDAKIRISLRQEIRAIQRQLGITTIYVTHDQEEALSLSDRIVVMNQGRIEQIGTPAEIYNFPQTRFVASFVGTLNVLNAQVIDARAGRVAIDGQELHIAGLVEAAAGATLAVALRPETIALTLAPNESMNHLRGNVEDVQYLGPVVRVRVRLNEQSLHYDAFNRPDVALPRLGEPVDLAFPAEAALALR